MRPRSARPPPRETPILIEFAIILALTLLNGVFAAAEIAVISIRKTRLVELIEEGSSSARAVAALRENPERFLATVQVGLTVLSSTASAFGGASVAARISEAFGQDPAAPGWIGAVALGVVVVGVSYLNIVLGELIPKSLAIRYGERYALFIAPLLAGMASVARPAVWLLTGSSNLVLRFFGDSTTFTESRHTREELQQLLDETATAGTVGEQVSEIASRALDFEDLDASDVMVPRSEIRALSRDITLEELAAVAHSGGHARMPVYEGSVENIVGLVNIREALAHGQRHGKLDLNAILHPVLFVAENMAAPDVLRDLQARRSHMAMVVDEQGSVRGLVTVEDLVEELVGEIFSENDAPKTQVRVDADGSALVPATVPVHEINRELGMELPEGENFSTLAGLAIHLAGRIPNQGDVLDTEEGYLIEVVEASPRRVRIVRIRRVEPPAAESSEAAAAEP